MSSVGGFNNSFKALKMTCISFSCLFSLLSCFNIFRSIRSSFNKISLLVSSTSRILVNTLIILMFTSMAVSLFSTLDSMPTPCSVNTFGSFLNPILSLLDVAFCDFQSSNSRSVNWNIKSSGKRFPLRFTVWFSVRVSTRTSRPSLCPSSLFYRG